MKNTFDTIAFKHWSYLLPNNEKLFFRSFGWNSGQPRWPLYQYAHLCQSQKINDFLLSQYIVIIVLAAILFFQHLG